MYTDFAADYDRTVLSEYQYTSHKRVPRWLIDRVVASAESANTAPAHVQVLEDVVIGRLTVNEPAE